MIRHVLSGAILLMAMAARPASARPAEAICPSLDFVIVYTDELTPGGTMEGFEKAVADQSKWYADHGFKDRIFAAPVVNFDESTHTLVKSPTEIMTFHMQAHPLPENLADAAWNAFVAEYRANSTIKNQTTVCYPD